MNGDMLDTNVIVKFLDGDDNAKKLMDSSGSLSVSVIVFGELHYGAQKSKRKQENLDIINRFFANLPIVYVDESIAAAYGEIKEQLHSTGINIPENDIWIAATAKAKGCRLVSFDKHFSNVNGLELVS